MPLSNHLGKARFLRPCTSLPCGYQRASHAALLNGLLSHLLGTLDGLEVERLLLTEHLIHHGHLELHSIILPVIVTARVHIAATLQLVLPPVNLLELVIVKHKRCARLISKLELVNTLLGMAIFER